MIYQVKGISEYVWGMRGCVWVCEVVHGYAQVCPSVHTCTWVGVVCAGVHGCVWKCTGVRECVCWMNFQNIFWRLESIHQRTLIRILYEFFINSLIFVNKQLILLFNISKSTSQILTHRVLKHSHGP